MRIKLVFLSLTLCTNQTKKKRFISVDEENFLRVFEFDVKR